MDQQACFHSRREVVGVRELLAVLLLLGTACYEQGGPESASPSLEPKMWAGGAGGTVTFLHGVLLGKPTDHSITVKAIADQAVETYFEYGTTPGVYTGSTTSATSVADPVTPSTGLVEAVITGLVANTKYYYRMRFRAAGSTSAFSSGPERSFRTQRARTATFKFTVHSDSHMPSGAAGTLFTTALGNIAADDPDFLLDLGDSVIMDTVAAPADARTNYLSQRSFFGAVGHSLPVFLVLGNHENEEGWNLDDATPLPILGVNARKRYFVAPVPDGFYTGNTDDSETRIEGDRLRADYYAFEWGNSLFVVIDPFWYTPIKPFIGNYGGEPNDEAIIGNRWTWTLGSQQYEWLKTTLRNSNALNKFIFTHQLAGGMAASGYEYGRGGANAARYGEWGGDNTDGTRGFETQRPGWEKPVHDLLVETHVRVVFHGHDHLYAQDARGGVIYQEVPRPSDTSYGMGFGTSLYPGATTVANSGHMRVTVNPTSNQSQILVEYVRAYTSGGTNRSIGATYTIGSLCAADWDGDGSNNCQDQCPNHAGKTAPGVCGCAVADTDSDGDGTPNCIDPVPYSVPYTEEFESGAGGWADAGGTAPTIATDATSGAGPSVMSVSRIASGGDYFSPRIEVTPGQTYCVAANIKWIGGAAPFVGVLRSNSSNVEWLIGSAYSDAFGPTTLVEPASSGWQHLTHQLVMPAGSTHVQLVNELYGGVTKPGAHLATFDGISITAGACPSAVWVDKGGVPAAMVSDPNAPSGGPVQKVDRVASGGDYFSPLYAVTAGQTYCVASDIKWVGGGTPFIGIQRSNASNVEWLIGSAYVDAFGATAIVDPVSSGWQHITREIVMPAGTELVRLVNELFGGVTKAGSHLAYFDGVSLTAGACPSPVWVDRSGVPAVLVDDPNAPSGGPVHQVDRTASGGDYFSPWTPVTVGQTYCVASDIKWVGGGTPFIGVLRSNSSNVEWLIGSAYTDAFGPTTVVNPAYAGWQHLTHELVMPAGTTQIRLVNELFNGATKAGADLAYFDGVSITPGACPSGLWVDRGGVPAVMVSDPSAPSGGPVHKVDRTASGGDYFSPPVAVTAGQTYCVAAQIKWVGGGTPFVGILRSNASNVEWLMGSAYTDAFGPTTVIDPVSTGWQFLAHQIVMPVGTAQVQLVNELFDGVTKAGSHLAYFDGVSITTGACP